LQKDLLGIQIVDDYWKLLIDSVEVNSITVVTEDIVGDGSDIKAYTYRNGKLFFRAT